MKDRTPARPRLALVISHPIQYYAPWFAYLTAQTKIQLHVFYLWDFGVSNQIDPGFGCPVQWNIDLLTGYNHSFVPNLSRDPGTHHFRGLDNLDLVNALVAWRPDAILLFGYRYRSHLRVLMSRRLRRVPVLFRGDSHLLAGDGSSFRAVARRALLPILFRRFAAFLSPGRAHDMYLKAAEVPRRKIFRSPQAVDNQRFLGGGVETESEARKWRGELNIPTDHRVILFAGKFENKKRPQDLVQAFIAAQLPRATLLLVGSGALEGKLRRLAFGQAHIRFAPFQNQREMPRVYATSALVVLPSAGPGESWGLVINEAMCCGKAVVVSDDVGCQADLVDHGGNGLVFPAGNLQALAETLTQALSDFVRLERWGAEGRKIISAFDYAAATAGLEAALSSLPQQSVHA